MRAVYLPKAGQWTVRFTYSPMSFKLGLYTSFLAAMTLLLLGLYWLWGKYYRPESTAGEARTVAKNSLVPMALILKEPDLGTSLLFVPLLFATLWVSGARTKHLALVVGFGVASLPLLYSSLPDDHYQKARVHAFLPFLAPEGPAARKPDTFQRDEALVAGAGGGITGQGWGEGAQNTMARVPFDWTDLIFVVHAEEWGLAGVVVLLGLWGALLAGLASLAAGMREPAGRLLCVGAMVVLGTQASVNMAMTMGLAPITGVPLPFLSYGGSAMLTSWLLLALALNAKAREPVVFTRADFD